MPRLIDRINNNPFAQFGKKLAGEIKKDFSEVPAVQQWHPPGPGISDALTHVVTPTVFKRGETPPVIKPNSKKRL